MPSHSVLRSSVLKVSDEPGYGPIEAQDHEKIRGSDGVITGYITRTRGMPSLATVKVFPSPAVVVIRPIFHRFRQERLGTLTSPEW